MLKYSSGHMYGDIWTLSLFGGKFSCEFSCPYCWKDRFKGDTTTESKHHFIEEDFNIDLNYGEPKTIFICEATDICSPALRDQDITRILDHCHRYPHHTFWVQSKNPERLLEFAEHGIWEHAYIGTTLESDLELGQEYMGFAPSRADRAKAMQAIAASGIKTYTTLEPLMKFSSAKNFAAMVEQCNPEFVFIGRESLRRVKVPEPFRYEVFALRAEIEKFTRVIMKENAQVWM